mmetsp:Transcript_51456/g.159436  ORF Transcript_51456/g.159436 Transcript_51456/m.159436 type:complete len:114 (-) Transcript_51456:21-362(-)
MVGVSSTMAVGAEVAGNGNGCRTVGELDSPTGKTDDCALGAATGPAWEWAGTLGATKRPRIEPPRRRLFQDEARAAICSTSVGNLPQWCGTRGPGQLGQDIVPNFFQSAPVHP